ncbi:MAG: hypothetical protein U1D55_01780 [Phycisphaerae bacterium]
MLRCFSFSSSCLAVIGLAVPAWASTPARIVVRVGDAIPGGLSVSQINDPYTNGNGTVGLLIVLSDSSRGIWYDTGPIYNSSSLLPNVATGGEGTIGVSNTGGFIYSPSYNGNDAVVTHAGLLLQATDPIPNTALFSSFNSRPTMSADGTAWWVGGVTSTAGGATQGRAMMKCSNPADPSTIQILFRSGDTLAGETIDTTGIQFGYDVSDNGLHLVNIMDWTGATATDAAVVVDGVSVAREGSLVVGGSGAETWTSFAGPGVNNTGDYVFSGDTTNATTADQVIYFNGAVIAREGQVIGGVTLGGATNWTSINNLREVVFIESSSETETLFWGTGPSFTDLAKVASVGDQLDIDGDTIADFTLSDFNASAAIAPGLSLADDGWVYADVDITPIGGGTAVVAIVGFRTPRVCAGDLNGDRAVNETDLGILLAAWLSGPGGDLDGDGDTDSSDLGILLANWDRVCP